MTISVCMIVENEEKNIRDCLENLKWADEIIVIDNRSTDKTVEICKEFKNVRVYVNSLWTKYITCSGYLRKGLKFKRIFRFATSRNRAIKKATGDWVLVLDADERIYNSNAVRELTTKYDNVDYTDKFGNKNKASIQAWYLIQESITEHGHKSPCKTTRLWRNGLGIVYQREVHETPDNYIDSHGIIRGDSDLKIEHIGFKDGVWNQEKSERIIDAIEWESHIYKNYYLGIAYLQKKDFDTGIYYLNLALEDPMPYNISAHAHTILADIYRQYMEFYYNISVERINSSLKLTNEQNLSYLTMAGLYKFRGQRNKAVKELYKIFNRDSLKSQMHQDILLSKDLIQEKIKELKNGVHTST